MTVLDYDSAQSAQVYASSKVPALGGDPFPAATHIRVVQRPVSAPL